MDDKRFIPLLSAVLLGAGALALAQDEAEKKPVLPDPAPQAEQAPPEAAAEDAAQEGELEKSLKDARELTVQQVERARTLVVQLADEAYGVREDATKGLWELGEVGMEAIKEGVESDDPEVAYRSKILLRRIMTGITPDTPEKIVELVNKYFRSGASGKKNVFQDLNDAGAFVQMLRIYRFEEDDATREKCRELVEKAVVPATDSELLEGDLKGAEELLRIAPVNDHNSRRLASVLRARDTLKAEAALIGATIALGADGKVTAATRDAAGRQLAMLRAEGKVVEARELAEKMGRKDVVAVMALFEGDPAPYLKLYMDREDESPVVRAHAETVLKRWQLNQEGADALMKEMANVAKRGGEEQREAILSLLLNGNLEAGLPLIFEANKDSAFSYYETVELPQEAVKVYGYVGSAEEKKGWLDERYKALRKDWPESEALRYEVLTIASFLYTRGERDEAKRIMLALSEIAWGAGKSNWLEFIGRLNDLGGSLYELAFVIAAEKLTPDSKERDDLSVIRHLFGEGESAARLWGTLKSIEEGKAKRVMILGALYGVVHMDVEEFDKASKALNENALAEGAVKGALLADLLEAAESRDDAGVALALLEKIVEIDKDEKWRKKLATLYGNVSDWEKALTSLEEVLKVVDKKDTIYMRYVALHAGTLIRADRVAEAKKQMQLVEHASLDEPLRLLRLAIDVERNGAVEEAGVYWRRLVMTNGPADWYWQSATSYFSKHARHQKQWRVAAAFAEVDALQYLKGRSTYINPVSFIRKRFIADLYRGLALFEEGNKEEALKLFRSSFEILNGDGILADDYFPLLREAGVIEEHDRNFEIVYQRLEESIKAYPKAHNTYNSAAWMASRACRKLEDAHGKIRSALAERPKQAAYLDTMAEVWFAKRNREKAVEWSRKAVRESFHGGASSEAGVGLREQYDRFQFAEFPTP